MVEENKTNKSRELTFPDKALNYLSYHISFSRKGSRISKWHQHLITISPNGMDDTFNKPSSVLKERNQGSWLPRIPRRLHARYCHGNVILDSTERNNLDVVVCYEGMNARYLKKASQLGVNRYPSIKITFMRQ